MASIGWSPALRAASFATGLTAVAAAATMAMQEPRFAPLTMAMAGATAACLWVHRRGVQRSEVAA